MKYNFFRFTRVIPQLKNRGRLVALATVFLLAACADIPQTTQTEEPVASPQSERLHHIVNMQDRLDRVAGILLLSNADLCRNQSRNLLGFSANNKYSYSSVMTSTVSRVFGLGERLQVTNVIPGTGAEKAGIEKGDIILTIEGKPAPQGPTAENNTVKMLSPLVSRSGSVKLTVDRQGKAHNLVIPLTRACGFRVELGHTDNVNAYSDGQRILITHGMMQFAKDDNELAYVISKEMAHNVLNHARALQTTEANRKIIDDLINVNPDRGAMNKPLKPMTKKFDLDSDTLGLGMALRAGFEIDAAVAFWTRLVQAHPVSNPASYTAAHPNSRARLEQMAKSIPRIKDAEKRKRARRGSQMPG